MVKSFITSQLTAVNSTRFCDNRLYQNRTCMKRLRRHIVTYRRQWFILLSKLVLKMKRSGWRRIQSILFHIILRWGYERNKIIYSDISDSLKYNKKLRYTLQCQNCKILCVISKRYKILLKKKNQKRNKKVQ